jgi:hypothetical protein
MLICMCMQRDPHYCVAVRIVALLRLHAILCWLCGVWMGGGGGVICGVMMGVV